MRCVAVVGLAAAAVVVVLSSCASYAVPIVSETGRAVVIYQVWNLKTSLQLSNTKSCSVNIYSIHNSATTLHMHCHVVKSFLLPTPFIPQHLIESALHCCVATYHVSTPESGTLKDLLLKISCRVSFCTRLLPLFFFKALNFIHFL